MSGNLVKCTTGPTGTQRALAVSKTRKRTPGSGGQKERNSRGAGWGDVVEKVEGPPGVAGGPCPGRPRVSAASASWEHRSAFGGKSPVSWLPGGDAESMVKPSQVPEPPGAPRLCMGPRPGPLRAPSQPSTRLRLLKTQLLPLLAQKLLLDMMSHSRLRSWPSVGLVRVQNTRPGPATVQDGEKTRGETLTSARPCPGTGGRRPLNATQVVWPSAWVPVEGQDGFSRAAAAASCPVSM